MSKKITKMKNLSIDQILAHTQDAILASGKKFHELPKEAIESFLNQMGLSMEKLHISDVSCSVCKSCEREICPRCDSRLIKYKVVDVNGKSLNKNSYICTFCSFISDLDVKHYN